MNYVFMTDASCDLTQELINEIGVEVLPMEFHMEDKSYLHYPDCRMMSLSEFYDKLKGGVDSKTTQINYDSFYKSFENYLKAGKDIIYTGISTGLSGTYNTCMMAVKDLQNVYPDRKIIVIDSLCDSAGLGLLIYLAGKNTAKVPESTNSGNTLKKPVLRFVIGSLLKTLTTLREAEEFQLFPLHSAKPCRLSRFSVLTMKAALSMLQKSEVKAMLFLLS